MRKKKTICLTISVLAVALLGLVFLTACVNVNEGTIFGTSYKINVWGGDSDGGVAASIARFNELEQKLSPAVESSEVSKINAAKANVPVSVSEDTVILFELRKSLYEKTNGAYNPAIFSLVELWRFDPVNYHETNRFVPSADEIESVLPLADFDNFILDKTAKTVTKSVSGAKLDFGASAKGYAADVAARHFNADKDLLAVVGGSVRIGAKSKIVGIADPLKKEQYLQILSLAKLGVSTSGSYERNFVADNVTYHHIIAPDGYPAGLNDPNPKISVTVVAGSAVVADILSTAGMIMDEDAFLAVLTEYNASAYLFYRNRTETFLNGFEAYIKK